jgi:hypothetical protein
MIYENAAEEEHSKVSNPLICIYCVTLHLQDDRESDDVATPLNDLKNYTKSIMSVSETPTSLQTNQLLNFITRTPGGVGNSQTAA